MIRVILYNFLAWFLLFLVVPPFVQAEDLSLNSYLNQVLKNSEELRAIELDIQSLRMEIEARDLELSPLLAVELLKFWDNRPSLSSNRQTSGKSAEVVLTKPLATGTNLNLSSYLETADYVTSDEQNLLNWQVGISQSLWQNSFGRQTRLRRQRDQNELKSRLLTLLQDQQERLVEFELLYWDIAYRQQEVKIRKENLERSQKILAWIQERFDRSAAEHVDLLQGQTLVASRELQFQLASETFRSLLARLKEKVLFESEINPVADDLHKERDLFALPATAEFAPSTPVLIETLQTQAQADFLKAKYEFESDQLRPELEVGYSYGRQGLSTSFAAARNQAFSGGRDYHQIGFVFSMPLDLFLIRKSRLAKQTAAEAEQMRSVKFVRHSVVQWEDIEQTVSEQKKRLETARMLAKLQKEKSQEERTRYEKGRTTAFQAISFEQDAAESELLVVQLLNQLRQTEARARVYIQKGI
jgi:outer membrane protein TolC